MEKRKKSYLVYEEGTISTHTKNHNVVYVRNLFYVRYGRYIDSGFTGNVRIKVYSILN